MPDRNTDLHGNAPDSSPVALLLVDVINDLEFSEGEQLLEHALPAARNIARLRAHATRLRIPVIYANDNFGRWRSDFRSLVQHCLKDGVRGEPIARLLKPRDRDYFVLKAKHSAFFHTTLELLLQYLGTRSLIVSGFAGNICVLFSASDAYLRDLRVIVPEDCCASNQVELNSHALQQMATVLKADTRPAAELNLEALLRNPSRRRTQRRRKR